MPRDIVHMWSCDAGEHFEDDAGLAKRLAGRVDDDGEERVMFAREGCMFRLTYEDTFPADPRPLENEFRRSRVYSVTLLTNSPTCAGGNVFTATWPNGYVHPPVRVVDRDPPSDAPVIVDGTMNDLLRVLGDIGTVMWPERYGR